MTIRVFWDEAALAHAPQFFLQRGRVAPNFEVPERATALLDGVRSLGLAPEMPLPDHAAPLLVHSEEYLSFLANAHSAWAAAGPGGPEVVANVHPTPEMLAQSSRRVGPGDGMVAQVGWFTADAACPIGPATWDAARAAASCAAAAARVAAAGGHAYALTRPPGHHAYQARAGGHCYLNNAAIAAETLRAAGAARVAVLDIDSHHGNGTQSVFWERADVLVASVHGDPSHYYPWFVGHADERGAGDGDGCNLNLPLARGTPDTGWLQAVDEALGAVHRFGPDAVVVSLGFDASAHEPLGFLAVSEDGFARAGDAVARLRRPLAIIQEGGYDTTRLGALLARFLGALS